MPQARGFGAALPSSMPQSTVGSICYQCCALPRTRNLLLAGFKMRLGWHKRMVIQPVPFCFGVSHPEIRLMDDSILSEDGGNANVLC